MTTPRTSQWPILTRLIATLLRDRSDTPLQVLTSSEGVGRLYPLDVPNVQPHHIVPSEKLVNAANSALRVGPVLILPPWERLEATDGPATMVHEEVLLGCEPQVPESAIVAFIPASTLTSQRSRQVRTRLAERWQIDVAMFATRALPELHPHFEAAIVHLIPRVQSRHSIRFFQVPPAVPSEEVESDFVSLLNRGGGRSRFGYVLRDPIAPGEPLLFARYDPRTLSRRAELSGYGEVVRLGELFEIRSFFSRRAYSERKCSPDDANAVRILTARDIQRDGTISPIDDQCAWAQVPSDMHLRVGDIVVRRLFRTGERGGFVLAEVAEQDLPLTAADSVIVLRPRNSADKEHQRFTMLYLRSPVAKELTLASTGYVVQVTSAALADTLIPQPDEALKNALADLKRAAESFEMWRSESIDVLQSVFDNDNPVAARLKLITAGRQSRLRAAAASLLDDFDHMVRTRFPYPIAYRWRKVEASLSSGPSQQAYETLLETAEILLCYAANLALVMARNAGIQLGSVIGIREKLNSGTSGPGLGEWVAVLQEVAGRSFKRLPADYPLGEVRSILADSAARDARGRISSRRNDLAHLRRIESVKLPEALHELRNDLTFLMKRSDFLSDLKLIHITSTHWDVYRKIATVSYREFMGDHPVVPSKQMTYGGNDLEQGSLYVMDADGNPHLLRPFLVGKECPECTQWSTFHVDRVRDDQAVLKSLEHGHCAEDPELVFALQQVGLL